MKREILPLYHFKCKNCFNNKLWLITVVLIYTIQSIHLDTRSALLVEEPLLITECNAGVVSFLPRKINSWKIRCPITMTTRTFNRHSIMEKNIYNHEHIIYKLLSVRVIVVPWNLRQGRILAGLLKRGAIERNTFTF